MAKTTKQTAEAKKAAPKKVEVKKTATPKVSKPKENNGFKWTDALKQKAHDELLVSYNKHETEKKSKLTNVVYREDGSASVPGIKRKHIVNN